MLILAAFFIGAFFGAFGMALAAMAGLIDRDEEIAHLRRQHE